MIWLVWCGRTQSLGECQMELRDPKQVEQLLTQWGVVTGAQPDEVIVLVLVLVMAASSIVVDLFQGCVSARTPGAGGVGGPRAQSLKGEQGTVPWGGSHHHVLLCCGIVVV